MMENIKEVDKIQLEYDLYETVEVDTLGRMVNILFGNLEEVDVSRSYIELEKKRNHRRRIISGVLGKHAGRFGYLDPYYYVMDDMYLERKSRALDKYYDQLNDIHHEINYDNFQELFRLMSFTGRKAREYRIGIDKEREVLKKHAMGEDIADTVPLDDGKKFGEWFGGALVEASRYERVEKVKK